MSLNRKLRKLKEENLSKIPAAFVDIMLADVEMQVQNDITKDALQVGEYMPNFSLKNAVGDMVDSEDLLDKGPLVISFYRGAWCPYCNIELAEYQERLGDIIAEGGQLIAISPELPDTSLTLVQKHALDYEILSDLNNEVAKQFGLAYQLDKKLQGVYDKFGIDLKSAQGNDNYELPFAATYVVDGDGKIIEASVNYDYTVRLEPEQAIEVLRNRAS